MFNSLSSYSAKIRAKVTPRIEEEIAKAAEWLQSQSELAETMYQDTLSVALRERDRQKKFAEEAAVNGIVGKLFEEDDKAAKDDIIEE